VKVNIVSLGIVLVLFNSACKKDDARTIDENNIIPNVQVDIYLNLNEPANYNLTTIGGWRYVTGGSRGLILYRGQDMISAYDRHTPLNSATSCAIVSVDSTNFFAVDACSGSRFLLVDGSVVDGIATVPLKQYRTSLISDVLRIYN